MAEATSKTCLFARVPAMAEVSVRMAEVSAVRETCMFQFSMGRKRRRHTCVKDMIIFTIVWETVDGTMEVNDVCGLAIQCYESIY